MMTVEEVRRLAEECARAIDCKRGTGTIVATIFDALAFERRLVANKAGAMLRDVAREAEHVAMQAERAEDEDEAFYQRCIMRFAEEMSPQLYALGDPEPEPEKADDEIAF